jgi:cytochrome c556
MSKHHLALATALLALGCPQQEAVSSGGDRVPAAAPDPAAWLLQGSVDERFARVAKHFRGFDMAMVEVGHRYTELYGAGQDRNWEYAQYQLDKIGTAVDNGVERRPARAESARMLEGALQSARGAVEANDPGAFDAAFTTLTQTCNACHQAERVPFVQVRPPTVRTSPVLAAPAEGPP